VESVWASTANGSYGVDDVISIKVQFSEAVTVNTTSGTPQLALKLGDALTRQADYSTGTGTDTLTFTYTVQATDVSADLAYKDASSLTLNGGSITDSSAQNALLTLPSPSGVGSLSANSAIVIDGVAPTVSKNTDAVTYSQITGGTKIITMTASEALTATADLSVDNFVVLVNGTKNAVTGFSVDSNQISLTLTNVVKNSNSVTVGYSQEVDDPAQLTDAVGNVMQGFQQARAVKVVADNTAPTVTKFFTTTDAGEYKAGDEINVSALVSEDVPTGYSLTAQLSIRSGAETVTLSSNGTNTLSGTYLVQDTDNVDTLSILSFDPNTIRDFADNAMTSTTLPALKTLTGVDLDTLKPFLISDSSSSSDEDSDGVFDGDDVLTLTFTEIVGNRDEVSAYFESTDDFGASGDRASTTWSADKTSISVTLGGAASFANGASISLPDIEDVAGNVNDNLTFIVSL
jgi:hypothetical protein